MTPAGWRILLATTAVLVAALVQTVVLSRLPLPGAVPDLTLVVLVGLAMAAGSSFGAYSGFGAGLLLDVLPPAAGTLGVTALALTLVGWLAGRVRDPRGLAPAETAALVAGLSVLAVTIESGLAWLMGHGIGSFGYWALTLVTGAVYSVLLGVAVIPAITATFRRLTPAGAPRRARRASLPGA
ncbi:MAG: rod shape-determining protein MreD [Candidatus Nanopelagicales bacterium]|nr:rod shape-determining protein MreD [Candidatus Nanopelagicales bacterium]MDZ4250561.1 rod shape-determining protein MreD [Candidatus Nanopelagicales bacterium]